MAGRKPAGGGGKRWMRGWTKAKEDIFFRELSILCNVSAALRTAGMVRASRDVYERRKRDCGFRAEWERAIAESYAMLEMEMLERSRQTGERPEPKSEAEQRLRAMPTSLGLALLRMHRAEAKGAAPAAASSPKRRPMRGQKLKDEMEARFAEVARRLAARAKQQ